MEKEVKFTYQHYKTIDQAPISQQHIIQEAIKAQQKAYAPYSNFRVGSALELEDGTIIHGSNQENKAYPDGLCAERTALFAYGANHSNLKIIRIGIVGDGALIHDKGLLSPCGSCRQVMAEFTMRQKDSFEIVMLNNDGSINTVNSIHELLPLTFGTEE